MSDALLIILGVITAGNLMFDKLTIRSLRRETAYLISSLLEVSGEKRAASTVRTGEPAPAREPEHPMNRPQQIGLGRRP